MVRIGITVAVMLAATPAFAVTDEQRQEIVEHFGKTKDLSDFTSGAINAAIDDPDMKSFFESYGNVVTVVQVADKIADAKDTEALQIIGGELGKTALEQMGKLVPALAGAASAVNFVQWANTGLGLFKDYVFDPYLEKSQFDTYVQLRGALDPEDAAAKVPGWGYMREAALKQLAKQGYNMDLLWENGEKGKLSPAWEKKLQQFVVASFEAKYERKVVADAAAAGKKLLPKLDAQAKKSVEKHAHDAGDEGPLAGDVVSTGGKDVDVWIDGKKVGKTFTLDKTGAFTVRVQVVGARRKQARELAAKHPAGVVLDGTPSDWAFGYSAGKNSSKWKVTDEQYTWKVDGKRGKVTGHEASSTHAGVKDDQIKVTVATDAVNETIAIDVSGDVKWEMTGTRATGAAAHDQADESSTASIVLHVGPKH